MTKSSTLNLSDDELEAKQFFMHSIKYYNVPIDTGDVSTIETSIPKWFDETKYAIGQKYFQDNRFGILDSNLLGLIILLAEPNGLEMLRMTEKSGTEKTARKRYAETVCHTLAWFEHKLTSESKAWKSLHHVRRLHLNASNIAMKKADGWIISKLEIIMTLFGFCGIALIRPSIVGIKKGTPEEREGYIHFWAVLAFMLGVDDDLNVCLKRPEIVELYFEIMLRYVFFPLVQIEAPNFKHMVSVMIDGMSKFIPYITYESRMFMVRRLCGIPGYQLDVDITENPIIKDIFNDDELILIENLAKQRKTVTHAFSKIPLIEFVEVAKDEVSDNNNNNNQITIEVDGSPVQIDVHDRIVFQKDVKMVVKTVERHELPRLWNDSKFKEMTTWNKFCVKVHLTTLRFNATSIGHYMNDITIGMILNRQKNWVQHKVKNSIFSS